MNIIEAYIKFNGQLIILISGLSGSGKSKLAKMFAKDFKLKLINVNKYYKKDYTKTINIGDLSVIDWDDADAIDWDRLNKDINESKNDGVIVSGIMFPEENIKFTSDIHFHVKISKKNLMEKRKEFAEKNKDDKPFLYKLNDSEMEQQIFNKITFPHYFKYLEQSKITKFLNLNESTIEELYDESFDFAINFIQQYLNKRNNI